jgi:hypothetical protein
MKTRAWITLLVSIMASAAIWALSPSLTGHQEPWDTDGSFYFVALIVAGAISGVVSPKPLWAHYAGAVIGQLGYELIVLRVGPLFVLGAIFLLVYCLVYLVAAGLAGHIRTRLTQGWHRSRPA